MIYTFQNHLTIHPTLFGPTMEMMHIEREPMVYDASARFAWHKGGDLTRQFLDELSVLWEKRTGSRRIFDEPFVIDTRVHMLKPGWLPAIGGWHCDAVPRGEDGQPDLAQLRDSDDRHFTLTIATDPLLSRTAFASTPKDVFVRPEPELGSVWSRVHGDVAANLDPESVVYAPHGKLVEFRRDTLHKATKADRDGWRFFARASYRPGVTSTQNKVRRQVQAYIESEGAGW
jgi:hypothetical protein